MLESIFKGILNISLYASVVALAVMLIKLACGQRLSPRFHYGIWFLLLLKLVFPLEISSKFSLFAILNRLFSLPVTEKVNTVLPPLTGTVPVRPEQAYVPVITAPAVDIPAAAQGSGLWEWASVAWLAGILAMLAVLLYTYLKTNRLIKASSLKPSGRMTALLNRCQSEVGLKKQSRLIISSFFEVPFISDFFRPVIVLPQNLPNNLTDEEIGAVLTHELMHIKRRDHWLNLILFLLKSVYWFNPLIWLAFAWMKKDAERACDNAVIRNYPAARRGEYARALLNVAACRGKRLFNPAVSAFLEGDFKQRVKNILSSRRYSSMAALTAVIVVVVAGIILLTNAQGQIEAGPAGSDKMSSTSTDDNAAIEVTALAEDFGRKLQTVSLLAPTEVVSRSLKESYGGFVSPGLLAEWMSDPQKAPGRLVSSPWPDRIEVLSLEKGSGSEYVVKGKVIEITSVEAVNGGAAAERPITLSVEKNNGRWQITAVKLGEYQEPSPLLCGNVQYGFTFSLPASWQGYTVITGAWEGFSPGGSSASASGPLLSIRHPQWTAAEPRQDIPILVLTLAQWNALQQDEFHIGAAPINPRKLGSNSQFVFALPARYNSAFPSGYEEVEKILEGNPLQANEKIYRQEASQQDDFTAVPTQDGSLIVEKTSEVIPDALLVSKTASGYAHNQHLVWVDGRYKKEAGELFLTLTDPEGNLLQSGGFLAADEIGAVGDTPSSGENSASAGGWTAFSCKLSEDTMRKVDIDRGVIVFELRRADRIRHGELAIPLEKPWCNIDR